MAPQRGKRASAFLLAALGAGALLSADVPPGPAGEPASASPAGSPRSYASRFTRAETPISEGGRWEGGKSAGLDWNDVSTADGCACGLESGSGGYDDSTALLAGAWGPNQTAEATVHSVNQSGNVWEEVELRLRSSLSAHRATGYEINFRCLKTAGAYTYIVRWDGPLGKFTPLSHRDGPQYGVREGDVVKATIVGNVITAYINGIQVNQATDRTFTAGSPGMGFYLQEGMGINRDYGFTRFSATDGP